MPADPRFDPPARTRIERLHPVLTHLDLGRFGEMPPFTNQLSSRSSSRSTPPGGILRIPPPTPSILERVRMNPDEVDRTRWATVDLRRVNHELNPARHLMEELMKPIGAVSAGRRWTSILFAGLLAILVYAPTPVSAVPAAAKASEKQPATVDINKAAVEEFLTIRGIGPVIAHRIVEFREENGNFRSIDDLLKIRGIGEKFLDKIRDQLRVSKPRR
ncbi:MAG: ComEA family DNA-binding protein [Acidobacteriota bacterium]